MYVDSLIVKLKVERIGEGTPVIMLHGFGVDSEIMKGFLEQIFISRSGWQRIYIDTPGYGGSDYNEKINSSDAMLEIIVNGIKQLVGDSSFILAGLSYGGYLARGITYLLKEQVQGLFLICPVIKAYNRELPTHEILVTHESNSYSPGFRDMAVVQTDRVWVRYQVEIIPGVNCFNSKLNDSELLTNNLAFSFEEEMMESYFDKPMLIINGRQDSLVGYRDVLVMLESCPHTTYAILDHAGHLVEIEQEKLVTSLVEEWLDRVEIHKDKNQIN
jgi:pimeloyl-ACP methyl ester carboxylesterase